MRCSPPPLLRAATGRGRPQLATQQVGVQRIAVGPICTHTHTHRHAELGHASPALASTQQRQDPQQQRDVPHKIAEGGSTSGQPALTQCSIAPWPLEMTAPLPAAASSAAARSPASPRGVSPSLLASWGGGVNSDVQQPGRMQCEQVVGDDAAGHPSACACTAPRLLLLHHPPRDLRPCWRGTPRRWPPCRLPRRAGRWSPSCHGCPPWRPRPPPAPRQRPPCPRSLRGAGACCPSCRAR
jgi:hypothetical protein